MSYWNPFIPEEFRGLEKVSLSERYFDGLRKERDIREFKGFMEGKLTKEERAILREVITKEQTSSEIAKRLGKSRRTVENLLQRAYRKLKEWFGLRMEYRTDRATLKSYFASLLKNLK